VSNVTCPNVHAMKQNVLILGLDSGLTFNK
jgi:hypothetical protein